MYMAYLEEHLITNLATFARFNDKALTPHFFRQKTQNQNGPKFGEIFFFHFHAKCLGWIP